MAKKKNKSKSKGFSFDEKSVKAVLALFILLLAFGVFYLFYTYQDNILYSSFFQLFMVLTVVCFGLLVGLLFLVNKPQKN